MIAASTLARDFEEIIGWPYVSPRTNDENGIDCSGAFVRAYKKRGMSIYHGSNTIFRKHCTETGRILGDASRLRVGMAVFKQRIDDGEPSAYQGDGFGNMYHIGLVAGENPLRIVHATTPAAKVDTTLGAAWAWYGRLTDVDYGGVVHEESEGAGARMAQKATAISPNGKAIHLRPTPGTDKPYLAKVPVGTPVIVYEQATGSDGAQWAKVEALGKRGYMMADFLVFERDEGTLWGEPELDDLLPRIAEVERLLGETSERLTVLEELAQW